MTTAIACPYPSNPGRSARSDEIVLFQIDCMNRE
jgi:hypothetical protein